MTSPTKQKVLIVDDNPSNINLLLDYLENQQLEPFVSNSGENALQQIPLIQPDLILLDILMPGLDGFETCKIIRKQDPEVPIIFLSALSSEEDKVKGFEFGANDYITKPLQYEEVIARVKNHLRIHNQLLKSKENQQVFEKELLKKQQIEEQLQKEIQENQEKLEKYQHLLDKTPQKSSPPISPNSSVNTPLQMVGSDPKHLYTLKKIEMVAPTDSTVLLYGESGTGKELYAEAIFQKSLRKDKPFIKVNCAAIPEQLVESEFFGHEQGSFTSAQKQRIGRFEAANQGTIFLDEIGELSLEVQAKLLRVFQERELERVGSSKTIKVDVRIIASTNKNLEQSVKKGLFRKDLFYRINVFPLYSFPLRERPADILEIAYFFVAHFSQKMNKPLEGLSDDAIKLLQKHHWPGNIRELRNTIERAVIQNDGPKLKISPALLELEETSNFSGQKNWQNNWSLNEDESLDLKKIKEEVEYQVILQALQHCNWIIEGSKGAAKKLNMAPSTLRDRMRKLNIKREESQDEMIS